MDEKMTELTNELQIVRYLHCNLCLEELPAGWSPQEYGDYEIGWTIKGIQIWCKRHDCNIMHMDFEGQKHPADTTRAFRSSDIKVVKG